MGVNSAQSPSRKPDWLEALLSERFFAACTLPKHAQVKKNEKNIFCLDCCLAICQHCVNPHTLHRLLQIRRYVYHDVVRLQDIQKVVDCMHVQAYIINSAKVVFLNQRPQLRPPKALGNSCKTCDRSLQDAFKFCSVACKIDAAMKQGKEIQALLPRCTSLHLSDFANMSPAESIMKDGGGSGEEEQLSPNTVINPMHLLSSSPASSSSTTNEEVICGGRSKSKSGEEEAQMPSPASTTITSIKRLRLHPPPSAVCHFSHSRRTRRKGLPERAPFQ